MISSTQAWSPASSTATIHHVTGNVVFLYPDYAVGASTFTISSTGSDLCDESRHLTRSMKAAARRVEHWDFIRSRCCTYEEVYEPAEVLIPHRIVVPRYYPKEGLGLRNWSHRYRSK